ncbi:MAG: twin transmembrane helix small protein [Gammaproteobacteria bacterium]|nr:twin transmembrane helix small protein [Gammaproteobacteria bacterium]
MIFKAIVVAALLLVVSALFSGLYYMLKDKGQSTRAVKSLTWRIALSVALFALLLIGAATGLIEPHGLQH